MVGLVLLIVIALQVPKVQQFAAQKGASYLASTWNTTVRIGSFTTDWRNAVVLENVYIEDQQQDTLWYSGRLGVDIKIFALINGELNVDRIHLQNATANLHIRPDSTTNFDFIMDAFATDTTVAQPADTAAAMKINLGLINLENVYVNFRDEYSGNLVQARVGQLLTTLDELDLDTETYRINEVNLKNTWVTYTQTKLPPETEPEPLTMNFGLNRVGIENVRLKYNSQPGSQFINLAVGRAELTADDIDLVNAKVDLSKFELQNTTVAYAQEKYKSSDSLSINPAKAVREIDESVEKSQGQPVNWRINLSELDVTGLTATVNNHNVPELKSGMDFDHLAFDSITVKAENIFYSLNRMGGDINQLQLKEKSGFRVNNMQGEIKLDSTSASVANLNLQTGHTSLKSETALRYPSLDAIAKNPETLWLSSQVDNSIIGMRDVLYFVPDLAQNPQFRPLSNSSVRVDANVEGTLANLAIAHFRASGLRGTRVNVSGNVRNAMEPENMYLDLSIRQLASTRTDVLALAPKGTIPPDINLAPNFSVTGNYKGTLEHFDLNADVRTTFGNLVAKVDMDAGRKGAEPFQATINTNGFDLGQLLTGDMGLGKVAAEAKIKGTGLDPAQMVAQLTANVRSLEYNGYTYKDVNVNADINKNLVAFDASSTDPNLAFTIDGDLNLRDADNPAYNVNLDLQGVNLQALNLYPDDVRIQGKLSTDLRGSGLKNIAGTVTGSELIVTKDGQRFPVDTLLLTIAQNAPGTNVNLVSSVANLTFTAQNNLEDFAAAATKHFSNYFDLQPDQPYAANLALDDFSFSLQLRNTGLITAFVPDLERLVPGQPITGKFNGETQDLDVAGSLQRITYMGYDLKAVGINLEGDRDKIFYNFTVQELSDSTLLVNNIGLTGNARDNTISTRIGISDNDSTEVFALGGKISSQGDDFRFSISPKHLILNSEPWSVPDDNYIQFGGDLLYANNVRLERNGSFISLNSEGAPSPNSPLNVAFGDFHISTVMEMVQRQDSTIGGTINGTARLTDIMSGAPGFTSDLTVSSFTYLGNPVGDIALKASTAGENRYNINAALTGNGNQLNVAGTYAALDTTGVMNLTADIGNLNLKTFESFTMGMVRDMDGSATGNLRITGSLDDPNILGNLNFNAAQFNLAMLNAVFKLPNEQIRFTERGINFPKVTVADASNNTMRVNGNILTQNYADYTFDLSVSTDRFLAMNSTAKDNDLYFGTLWIDADATIKGKENLPVVNATVAVLDGSALSMVIPGAAAGAAEREGVVEFFDADDSLATILQNKLEAQNSNSGITGFEVDVNLAITDATPISVVIDPVTGDNLEVRGNSRNLAASMNTRGDMRLSGRYTISEGQYELIVYNLVTREMQLREGSYVQWNGDPLQAEMDITAVYELRTSTMELMTGFVSPDALNQFRTPMNIEVLVDLEGELMKPEIDFGIEIPDKERSAQRGQVENRLGVLRTDEAELNKQVFSLLVLGRFMAEDPLASSGGGLSSAARNSVGQVMSDQLNKLSDQYAGGLGLEFGVNSYEDYSTGTGEGRTDLNVALRQQLFNDRVTVRVGTDVGLEGRGREQNNMSNFGGDISVEYTILPDGRLRVRGFRRNNYESFIDVDVQETGLALIYVRDYNNFSDLFRGKERRSERQKERKQEERQELKKEVEKAKTDEEETTKP